MTIHGTIEYRGEAHLKSSMCVYYLFIGDDLLYIGRTWHIGDRLLNHKCKNYDRVLIKTYEDEDELNKAESIEIKKYNPPLNINRPNANKVPVTVYIPLIRIIELGGMESTRNMFLQVAGK